MKSLLTSTLVSTLMFIFFTSMAHAATTFTVCPSGTAGQNGCNYIGSSGIQQAIDAIPDGSQTDPNQILIKPGLYTNVALQIGTTAHPDKKYIELIGEDLQTTTLDGGHIESKSVIEIDNVSHVTIQNITIQNGLDGGITLNKEAQVKILSNIIKNNGDHGVMASDSVSAFISKNQIISTAYEGLVLDHNVQATISNNLINDNGDDGISMYQQSGAIITNNQISNNLNSGISLYGQNQATITNNTVVANEYQGIDCGENSSCTVINNISINNLAVGIIGASAANFLKLTHNLSWGNQGQYNHFFTPDQLSSWHNLSVDPKFVSTTDFHLQAGSPAVNSGDPNLIDPDGTRSDMGMYGGPQACHDSDCITPTSTPTPTPRQVYFGDTNQDNRVDFRDILNHINTFGIDIIQGIYTYKTDLNNDKVVNIFDYVYSLQDFGLSRVTIPTIEPSYYVRARGTALNGIYPTFQLLNRFDTVILEQTVTDNWENYAFTLTLRDRIMTGYKIKFINDSSDRNLYVDYLHLHGQKLESEADTTYSTGTWNSTTQSCSPGYPKSESLHCNGYFEYNKPSDSNPN